MYEFVNTNSNFHSPLQSNCQMNMAYMFGVADHYNLNRTWLDL
jgi:hypothetical protein